MSSADSQSLAVAEAAAPVPLARPRGARISARIGAVPWWFVLPALAFYVFVVLWPSIEGAGFAFTNWDGLSATKDFVGFAQFQRLLTDPAGVGAVVHTLLIALSITIVQNLVGLLLALGVHTKIKSRNVLRVALFTPAVITPVATGYLWKYLMTPDGAINQILGFFGLTALQHDWLGDANIALWSIVATVVWQFAGYSMVIFLAGLQGVPEDVLEASRLDGAGPFRRFWYVVRPELAPAITINLMLSIIGGLKLFDQVWVMTSGGPGTSTDTMSTLIYKNAFQFGDFSYGIAMALVLAVFVAILSSAQYKLLGRQGGSK
ncbi:carbohydrate ABC transporter permease [Sinomonas gamaensis]|uniref:carbohydrate ABC transporter permease n=1 Tax=Sinomonas gamaensis TaxID=2565624 RepID=UPI001108948F|nr:sugar ABC transporter permease [Sinomonas gamaensis]